MTDAKHLDYLAGQFQLLMDMHVPEWNAAFLTRADARVLVDAYTRAGADGVMVYANSHVGECFYPTKVGRHHAGLKGADLFGEQVRLLRERGVAVCAYYSANFNVHAWRDHPDWRLGVSDTFSMGGPFTKYGVCCLNSPGFAAFQLAQVEEIVTRYMVDAFFFDMVFWADICICEHCRTRYRREAGAEIPATVDWSSPDWCRFQSARERWLLESFLALKAAVKARQDVPVYCNASVLAGGWKLGTSLELMAANDLLGGDLGAEGDAFYGSGQVLSKLSGGRFQYMSNISGYAPSATAMCDPAETLEHAHRAAFFGARFLAIDGINADGSTTPEVYKLLGDVFAEARLPPALLGGVPLADVAVYWSFESAVDFADNGSPLQRDNRPRNPYAHFEAAFGALGALRRAGIAAGIVTRLDLGELSKYPVVVLPNVLRLSGTEIDAFRSYVASGGRLYASGFTSLVDTAGARCADFQLGDLFGVRLAGESGGTAHFLKPTDGKVAANLAPRRLLALGDLTSIGRLLGGNPWCPLLELLDGSECLGTLTLPYGEGIPTTQNDEWASIHNEVPWQDSGRPLLVRRRSGAGQVVYAGVPLETPPPKMPDWLPSAGRREAGQRLFAELIADLLGERATIRVSAHPDAWVAVKEDPESGRLVIVVLNAANVVPALPIPLVEVFLSARHGMRFGRAFDVASGLPASATSAADGSITVRIDNLVGVRAVALEFDRSV